MATGIDETVRIQILKKMTQRQRALALVRVLEEVKRQRELNKGKEARSYAEKKQAKYKREKLERAKRNGAVSTT